MTMRYEFWIDNVKHESDKHPSEIYEGSLKYFRDDGGPSYIFYNDLQEIALQIWCAGNITHREDGPAIIEYDREKYLLMEKNILKNNGNI